MTALGPAFAAGFAVQQLLEIADPLIAWFGLTATAKKALLGVLSLVIGLAIADICGLRVLQALESRTTQVRGDLFVTGVVISAGTEGFNSIMKFLGYSKDARKAAAAEQVAAAGKPALQAING
jgi:hypothetical protein